MKKSTGIVFLLAAALAAFVYFGDWKHPATDQTVDNTKPAFNVASSDITQITLARDGKAMSFDHRNDGWYITQPLQARADQGAVDAVADQLSTAHVERTLTPGTAGNAGKLEDFGLASPAITIDFTAKNGARHTLGLGSKEFSGSSVYARIDGSKDVSLLSETVLNNSDKPLNDFRDHDLMQVSAADATSFELTNESGELTAVKKGTDWNLEKPRAMAADSSAVMSLLDVVGAGRISNFVSDTSTDLGKYGLAKPAIRFSAKLPDGKSGELEIGKKEGDQYYARDASRAGVFEVQEAVYKALSDKPGDLRDKQLVHLNASEVTRAEVRDQNGATSCVKGANDEFTVEQAAGTKTPAAPCADFLPSIENAHAQEVYDAPPAGVSAKLAKPAVQITLTDKNGKKTEIRVSPAVGDSVYAQTNAG